MSNNLVYKKATLEDAALLAALRVEFLEDFFGRQGNAERQTLIGELELYFKEHLAGNYISFMAFSDNEAVGVGAMIVRWQPGNFKNPSGRSAYLLNMYTKPHWRRRGICKKILDLLVTEARTMGLGLLELHSTQDGELVYPAWGFALHPEPTYRLYLK